MIFRKGYIYAAAACGALLLQGCGSDPLAGPDSPDAASSTVTLNLRVAMAEFPDKGLTRAAFPGSDDLTFEGPLSDYEKIRTLRVIIVHADGENAGKVEHNRLVTTDTSSGAVINDNLRFRVADGEKKKIYLLANESATGYDFDTIREGEAFPEAEVADIRISRRSGAAFIDNGTTEIVKTYVPMSEVFVADIPQNTSARELEITEHFFVTRSTVKFSFHFSVPEDYPASGVSVTGVRLYGLADQGWYLPSATIYDPEKYSPALSGGGRYITSFSTPAGVSFSGYTFAPLDPIEIKKGMDKTFSPFIYFPETDREAADHPFRVSVVLDNGTEFLIPRDLTLDRIPRNTHVKINIEMRSTDADASVTLLPYTGIWLDPDFGL